MNRSDDRSNAQSLDPMILDVMNSPSYIKAYKDEAYLHCDSSREIRLLAEYLKADTAFHQKRILSTIIVFGSARILAPDVAERRLRKIETDERDNPRFAAMLNRAKAELETSDYYRQAREFARIVSEANPFDNRADFDEDEHSSEHYRNYRFVICTGGGPGIMEAANRGAYDAKGISIGLNISLPHEQHPNPFITPDLCFQYHYFAMRKLHFMLRAKALVAFPGGFGTFDELFEGLTLRQTGKMQDLPIVLFGEDFWRKCVDFDYLVETGVISPDDLRLFHFARTPLEGWEIIKSFYLKS